MRDDNAFLSVGNVDFYAAKNSYKVNTLVARNMDTGKVDSAPYAASFGEYRKLTAEDLVVNNLFKAVGGEM